MILDLSMLILAFFSAGAALIMLIHEIHYSNAAQCRNDWVKYAVFLAIVIGVILLASLGKAGLGGILAVLVVVAGREIYRAIRPASGRRFVATGLLAAVVAAGLGHLLLFESRQCFASFTFVFLIVAVTDSYAQLTGRLIGKRRLCPRISPNKTVAGFFGGLTAALVAAMAFGFLQPGLGIIPIILLGSITSLAAVMGDLAFSTVKRRFGIKDFSGVIPGHGGVLDRFDSLILAAPVFYWARYTIELLRGGWS